MKVEKREGGGYHLYAENESENMAIAGIIQVVFHSNHVSEDIANDFGMSEPTDGERYNWCSVPEWEKEEDSEPSDEA